MLLFDVLPTPLFIFSNNYFFIEVLEILSQSTDGIGEKIPLNKKFPSDTVFI